jgi:hypothetical protein
VHQRSYSPIGRGPGLNPGKVRVRALPRARACSPIGRGGGFKSRPVQVRGLPGAPMFAPFAKRSKASVLQTDISQVRILEGVRACSSVAEPRADNAVTEVRFFTGTPLFAKPEQKHAESMQTGAARRRNRSCDRTRRVKPEWRGSGLLTRPQVARNHPGPPFRTSDPSGKGPGLLNRRESYVGSSPTWSSNIRTRGEIGRRTILRGWRATMSVRLRPSAPLPRLVK